MPDWPGNPVATMSVENTKAATKSSILFHEGWASTHTVKDVNIDFKVRIEYSDNPIFDYGQGVYAGNLYRLNSAGLWELQGLTNLMALGDDKTSGFWTDFMVLSGSMTQEIQ